MILLLGMEQIPANVRSLYDKGKAAFQRQHWDYAITLFTAALHAAPNFAPARTQLRLSEIHKFQTRKFPLWYKITSSLFNIVPYLRAVYYQSRKNWPAVLGQLEKPLRNYPLNYRLLGSLGRAAEEAGFTETACATYESMYLLKPADITLLKKLGKYYHKLDQVEKARNFYQKAVAIAPLDYEARKGLQDLAALGTISKGWEESGSYREKIRDEGQADIFEKEARLVRSAEDRQALISDTEKRLAAQLESIPLIRRLAELHSVGEDYTKAAELYQRAIKLDPADSSLRKDLAYIKIIQFDKQIRENPEKKKELAEKKQQFILENTKERVNAFPSHLPLRYEMGCVYMDRGLLDQAVAEFQHSVKDPKYKVLSQDKLGLCFAQKGMYDLAASQLQQAAAELHEWDELKKEIIYNLGSVYESMGQRDKALAEYKKIYEQDITYRDIAQKISQAY